MKLFRLFVLCLVLLPAAQQTAYCQESEAQLKEQAEELFEAERYIDATSLYLRLLALNPRSHDYNYRYGTCLLYNSYKKQDAFKYLNYAVTDPAIDVQAYYFLGKAFHLNYQFNEAIRNYELYTQKTGGKPKPSFDVERQIAMCQNGKRLLTTITDLIVLEKKESDLTSFFRKYGLDNIGGDLLVAADYQSKVDRKKGHVPLIHFPAEAKQMFYASYGDSDTGQKDIYVRKALPDGSWGQPQPVQGKVNTKFDEDFPYMNPNGEYLYFCSKGHNSMGGYDVFRARFNVASNSFDTPENLDFAVSSPDDDLLFIVDSLDRNAWFASTRQSANGNIHIYKVRMERVPLQLAVVKGTFASSVRPENKKITITVTDQASGEKIGSFASNEKGGYLITFPKGGKYIYEMKVNGSTVSHRAVVTVPFLKEFRPLKQKLQEETADGTEVVKITDLFDEDVEDPMGVLAEVIKLRSELNPNANQFDLEQLDAAAGNQKILADLGFEDASPQGIAAAFEQLETRQQEKVKAVENLSNGALNAASGKLDEAARKLEEAKALVNRANSAPTKAQKYALLTEAQEKTVAAVRLKEDAKHLLAFSDSVTKKAAADQELLSSIEAIAEEVRKEAAANNVQELKNLVTANSRTIDSVKDEGAGDPVDALVEQLQEVQKNRKNQEQLFGSYSKTEETLRAEIKNLQQSLESAKQKDKAGIENTIAGKTKELSMVSEEKENLAKKIAKSAAKEEALNKEIRFLQDVTLVNGTPGVSSAAVRNKLTAVDSKNNNTLASYIDQQVSALKQDPEIGTPDDPQQNDPVIASLEENYDDRIAAIEQGFDSPAEKSEALLATDREYAEQLETELERAEAELAKDPAGTAAQKRRAALQVLKRETEERIADREKEIAALSATPIPAITPETELEAIAPNHAAALENAAGSIPAETLAAKNAVDRSLLDRVNETLQQVGEELGEHPADPQLKERQQALMALKDQVEERIAGRETTIAGLEKTETPGTSAEAELAALMPDYEEQLGSAGGDTPAETLEARNAVDRKLIALIDSELEDVEGQLLRNPGNAEASERKETLAALKTEAEERIAERDETIAETAEEPVAGVSVKTIAESIRPEYRENVGKIEATMEDGPEKELALLREEQNLLTAIEKQIAKKTSEAAKDPANPVLSKTLEELKAVQEIQEATVSERELDLTAIEQAKIDPERFRSEILPSYTAPDTENSGQYTPEQLAEFVSQELRLQDQLVKRLRANEKKLEKAFNPKLSAENKVIAVLMERSVSREQSLANPLAEDNAIAERIAEDLGEDAALLMESDPSTIDEGKRILTGLNEYAAQLSERLEVLETTDPRDDAAIGQQKKQLAAVRERIGVVEADLDNMESFTTVTGDPAGTQAGSELNALAARENDLEKKLADPSLPQAEKRPVQKELTAVRTQKKTQETAVLTETLSAAQQERENREEALSAETDPTAKAAIERSNGLTRVENERPSNRDLAQQVRQEETAKVLLKTTQEYLEAKHVYDEKGLVTATRQDLEAQKRRFLIAIGQLEAVISEQKNDPSKTAETNALREQKRGLETAVETIGSMLEQLKNETVVENPVKKGLDQPLSYEKELELAGTPVYRDLSDEYREVQSTQRQLNDVLKEKQEVRQRLTTDPSGEPELLERLESLSDDERTLRAQLKSEQAALDARLRATDHPEEFRNLLARDVVPAKPLPAAAALVPGMNSGFELVGTTAETRIVKNIPVDLKSPAGLVYRVQVGAFAKPIPEDLFREFTPVTGEKLNNGITRYLAGYFGNRTKVIDAQRQIRALGYADAFVVAYCDGNRISLAEARRLEDLGLCVPKNEDSLLLEVVENTLAQLPQDSLEKLRPAVKPSDYNKAPGAAPAEAAEEHKGLFFTVQVGVYNRPVSADQVKNIDPLITKRLENGQIRYSSGMFPSIEAARPKRAEAIARGISDAFITAYFNGERIPLDAAKRILAEQGAQVLEPNMTIVRPDATDHASSQPPSAATVPVRFVSRERYNAYPRDAISRLNSHGSFYFDTADGRIKSTEYLPSETVQLLEELASELDTAAAAPAATTVFEPKTPRIVAVWEPAEIPGSAADWLLRLTLPHTTVATAEGFELSFEGIAAEEQQDLLDTLESYGASVVRLED